MTTANIYLVRSPRVLIKENLAGYGWSKVDFSEATTTTELLGFFKDKDIKIGRQGNQIKRFFAISKGDIIVVPLYRAIAIGYATGIKSYAKGVSYGENRVGVNYLKNPDGSLALIPRSELPEALSTRLRIRMSVVSLNEFEEDVLRILEQVKTDGGINFDLHTEALEEEARLNLQQNLLANLQNGKTFLKSGGDGLERLVAELFNTEGYATKIFSKNAHKGLADADIEAISVDRFSSNRLLVQVKHHSGMTNYHAFQQLKDLDLDSDDPTQCWVITSGEVSSEVLEKSKSDNCNDRHINVMNGKDLANWIIEQAHLLSPATRNRLGLSTLPTLLL